MRWKTILTIILPALAALTVYLNTLDAGFVHDDRLQIEDNPWVKQLQHLPDVALNPVWRFRTSAPSNFYRPTQMVVYNLVWAASGGRPLLFHLTNVLLHATATAALALLIICVTRDRRVAGGAALLFAVHPASTGTVAWVACLPELGYSLCILTALLLHIASSRRLSPPLRGLAWLVALMAMSFKETGMAVIPLVFLLEIWGGTDERRETHAGGGWWKAGLDAGRATLPYAALGLAYLVVRTIAVGGVAPKNPLELTLIDALVNAPALFFRYLKLLLWPLDLLAFHIFRPLPSPTHPAFLLGLPALLMVPVALLVVARRRGDVAFAGALCALPLLPVLYLPGLGINAFAERYVYLSTAGMVWIVVAAISALAGRVLDVERGARVALATAVLLALPMAYGTIERNPVWHDDESLALSVLAEEPSAWDMSALLAGSHERNGRLDEALAVYDAALVHHPGNQVLQANRFAILMRQEKVGPDEAIAHLERLAEDNPLAFEPHAMLGDAYLQVRRFDRAEAAFRKAIELNPLDEMLHNRLAVIYVETGRLDEAREALLRAIEIDPGFELARDNLQRVEQLLQRR